MKKLMTALIAVLIIFSFVSCSPSSSGPSSSQSVANRTDISAIFTDTFSNNPHITVTYSDTPPEAASAARSTTKIIYAIADYDGYTGDGDGVIDGSLVFVLQTTEENGVYTITSYSTYVPEGESLTITIGNNTHELDINVKEGTTASGTITKTGETFTATAVSVSEPSESEVSISIDGEDVEIKEEPVITPEPSTDGKYTTLLKDFYSTNMSMLFSSGIIEQCSVSQSNKIVDAFDASNTIGTYSNGTYTLNDGGSVHITEQTVFSWEGSLTISGSSYSPVVDFKNFRIKSITGGDVPVYIPKNFDYTKLNGRLAGDFSETGIMIAMGDLKFDGKTHSEADLLMGNIMIMIPMQLSNSYYFSSGSAGDLSELNNDENPMKFSGQWKKENGKLSISNGTIEGMGIKASFTLEMEESASYNRLITAYRFGSGSKLETIENANLFNAIMSTY